MSFADDLNSKVNEFNRKNNDVITDDEFVLIKVKQYTEQIKQLCSSEAALGRKTLCGFFAPERMDCSYDVTFDGPFILNFPKSIKDEKPKKTMNLSGYTMLAGGATEIKRAGIHLYDGLEYGRPIACAAKGAVDSAMIEKVRVGIIKELSIAGFKKLEIANLTGPFYSLRKVLLTEMVSDVGTIHYFYVDIAW